MKGIFCKNKTVEERLAATNRMIKLLLGFMFVIVGILVYELVAMFVSDRTIYNHLGQICSTLGVIVCSLSVNIKNKKEFEAEYKNVKYSFNDSISDFKIEADNKEYDCKNIILATGSDAFIPKFFESANSNVEIFAEIYNRQTGKFTDVNIKTIKFLRSVSQ